MTDHDPKFAPDRAPALLPFLLLLFMAVSAGCNGTPPGGSTTIVPAEEQPQRLPTATIRVGETPLVVEVARTKEEQHTGMMFRRTLGPDEAMFFVFDREDNLSFWMKNTWVDLDLAYIGADGVILQVERMKAHNLDSVYSREPARFVLEVPAGWFAKHGVGVGTRLTMPPEALQAPTATPKP